MTARDISATPVRMFDCVTVDGRRGTAIGFYARDQRTVLVRLDVAGLIEVPVADVVIQRLGVGNGWSQERRNDETAGRDRYDALIRAVDLGRSEIAAR